MPIPRLTAVQFHKFMGSGRTSPIALGCEDEAGKLVGEFVVKLRAGMDLGVTGLLCELIASRLASYFGIPVPEPALIWIDSEFAELVAHQEDERSRQGSARLLGSVGLNFGTRIVDGAKAWPVDWRIPNAMVQTAAEVFAFDALIQNPDRRYRNPNLLVSGNGMVAFDHELAFSFLMEILPLAQPWRLASHRYLADHVFYRCLKGQTIDIARFTALLAEVSETNLGHLLADVPGEWNNGSLRRISDHLQTLSAHAGEFAEEARRYLA